MMSEHMKEPKYYWDDIFPDEATANSMHKAIHGWDEWDKEHAPWIWSADGEIILRGAIHMSQDKANFILNALNQSDTLTSRVRVLEDLLAKLADWCDSYRMDGMRPDEWTMKEWSDKARTAIQEGRKDE